MYVSVKCKLTQLSKPLVILLTIRGRLVTVCIDVSVRIVVVDDDATRFAASLTCRGMASGLFGEA